MPEHKNVKNEEKHMSIYFFPFMRLCSKSQSCNRIPVVSVAAVFFKKAAIVVATFDQKTLHRQLSKVILSGMYKCNF